MTALSADLQLAMPVSFEPVNPEASPTFVLIEDATSLSRHLPGLLRLRSDFVASTSLTGRVCPVQVEDGRVAILALAEYVASDQVDELERVLRRAGHCLVCPSRYSVPAALLLTVTRHEPAAHAGRRAGDPLRQRSALAALFQDLVAWGVQHGASDIHLNLKLGQAQSEIRYSIGGDYVCSPRHPKMATQTLLDVLAVAWMDVRGGNGAVFDPAIEQQGRIALEVLGVSLSLRWASLATDAGPSVCLRILRSQSEARGQTLQDLGYLPEQVAWLERARQQDGGAIVLGGLVGSGKSTTLATLMRDIASCRKIITLEDPVEYAIPNALQNTVGRDLDDAFETAFDAKLKTLKRSAMHDLLLGEVRDLQTGHAFADLLGAGVSVYTTTHAASVHVIAQRLASPSIGVARDFLATPGVLKLLVQQALLPRLCPYCAVSFLPCAPEGDVAQANGLVHEAQQLGIDPQGLRRRHVAGCAQCRHAALPHLHGTHGRTVVAEMIAPGDDPAFLDCVRRADMRGLQRRAHDIHADPGLRRTGSVLACAWYLAAQGIVDPTDIARRLACAKAWTHIRGNP